MNLKLYTQESNLEIKQYLHDLQSPLAALKVAINSPGLPQDKSHIAKMALERLEEMSKNLSSSKKRTLLINTNPLNLLSEIFDEKRLEFSTKKKMHMELSLSPTSFDVICPLEENTLKRILSNILNNSFDAIDVGGKIKISTRATDKNLLIQIRDNGHGIAPELFSQLTQLGASFGKPNGSGVGLHHAKKSLNSWGGDLSIQSIVGEQTLVTISLPLLKKARPTLSLVS
jgi:signal transduction histidine kinase